MAKPKQPTLTIKQIETALRQCNGLQSQVAKKLNVTAAAISDRIRRSPHLQKVLEEITEKLIDLSENVLHEHMVNKNLTAAIFHLKTKGRNRGYIERKENELSGNVEAPLVIRRIIVKKEES